MRIFKEEQRFTKAWLIILLVISMMVPIGITIKDYINSPSSFSTIEFILTISFIVLAASLIFLFKLSTRIDKTGIHYKFFPFHWSYKIITWKEINNAYIRTYSPLNEYGGWGLRGGILWNTSKGKAINVSGDIGIQLELENGNKLLIGTQKQIEAESVLATYKPKIN
ncbi:hypothetical protein [Winogradskyella bathintestinalis]|uniref:PH domain-containing protein n=1 Tax=Winogradskyella bathintestinalis TaxID=3035208 RepID=A0ABT7ZUQ3_9FLAO|nr:hypothetical protein [Winogradskyella bathintestinalis]MDN3492534.1 hypothetical protein [Winogradskyella bathintestinalis]